MSRPNINTEEVLANQGIYSYLKGSEALSVELIKLLNAAWEAQRPDQSDMTKVHNCIGEVFAPQQMANRANSRWPITALGSNLIFNSSEKPSFPQRKSMLRRDPLRSPKVGRAAIAFRITPSGNSVGANLSIRARLTAVQQWLSSLVSPFCKTYLQKQSNSPPPPCSGGVRTPFFIGFSRGGSDLKDVEELKDIRGTRPIELRKGALFFSTSLESAMMEVQEGLHAEEKRKQMEKLMQSEQIVHLERKNQKMPVFKLVRCLSHPFSHTFQLLQLIYTAAHSTLVREYACKPEIFHMYNGCSQGWIMSIVGRIDNPRDYSASGCIPVQYLRSSLDNQN